MRLVIDTDEQYKQLFLEAAKAVRARVQEVDYYVSEAEEDAALLKLMEEGKKEGRLTEQENQDFKAWLRN